jgi:phosphoglycolate phosphatase-like HAD superfamily hydrolase
LPPRACPRRNRPPCAAKWGWASRRRWRGCLPEAEDALHRRLSQGFREAAHALRRAPGYAEPLYPGIREALDGLRHAEVFFGIATGKARRGLDYT